MLLFVGRVAVAGEDALDQPAQVGPHALSHGPVDGDGVAHRLQQLPGDGPQGLVAQHGHGAVVGLQGVVEGQLLLGQAQVVAPGGGLPHVSGQVEQLLDHLGRLDGAVAVAAQGVLQHLGERPGLHQVLAPPDGHFALQQPLQQLHRQVGPVHVPDLGQELVVEHRDVGPVQPGRREYVGHPLGGHRPGDDLAHRLVEVGSEAGLAGRPLGQRRPHRLEEGHVVADAQRLGAGHGQGEGLGQLPHRVQAAVLAVGLGQHVLQRRGQQLQPPSRVAGVPANPAAGGPA